MKLISNILLKNGIITEDDKDVYDYGSFVFIFNLLIILTALAIAFLLKEMKFMIFFLLFFIPLRMFVAGYHRKTPQSCFVVSELFILTIILMFKYLDADSLIFYVFLFTFVASVENMFHYSSEKSRSGIIGMIIFTCEAYICLMIPELRSYILYAWFSVSFLYYLKLADNHFSKKKAEDN